MPTSSHIIAYVQPSRLSLWQCLAEEHRVGSKPFLLYGSNDAHCFAKHAHAGSTLWIFCPQRKPYPPSLVARLVICGRDDDDTCQPKPPRALVARFTNGNKEPFKYLACGDPDKSTFYGLNEVGSILPTLDYEDHLEFRGRAWRSGYGRKFQRPRLLAGGNPTALVKLENEESERLIFVSWKHADHSRRKVEELARFLAQSGYSVWLDKLALPHARFALGRFHEDGNDLLLRLLKTNLARCEFLLSLDSRHYGTESSESGVNWTKIEQESGVKQHIVYPSIAMRDRGKSRELYDLVHRKLAGKTTLLAKEARWAQSASGRGQL